MKRYGNLWDEITSIENLRYAHEMAKRGKSHYGAVKKVEKDVEGHLLKIQKMLREKTFTTGKYKVENRIEGGKMRTIYKLPYFPDRIVHHALMSVTGPIFRKSLIRDTFQSLPKRGTSDARRRIQKMMKTDAQNYALKMDIKKYYPSVDNELMKLAVASKIKCKNTLSLFNNIIDSIKGLPIGSLVSQYLGNVFLSSFDWWVKQKIKVKYYFRYCDDLLFFSKSKEKLRKLKVLVKEKIESVKLNIKKTWQIVNIEKQGVDFVGYVFKKYETRLRKTIREKFCHHCSKVRGRKINPLKSLQGLVAYKGWVMRANCKLLWRSQVSNSTIRYCRNVYKSNPIEVAL